MKPDERDPVVDRLLEGLEPPQPPLDLRSKTLEAARGHAQTGSCLDVWTRIWNHRGLRFAWAATVFALLAGHVLVVSPGVAPIESVDPSLVAEQRADEYLVGLLRPVRISDNVRPVVGLFAAAASPTDLDTEGNPS